jgi:hypothetical protein
MRTTLSACAALLVLPAAGWADEPQSYETVIAMTVQRAPAPRPALKYQLLPELRDMSPGNPIHMYSKCFAEQYNFWRNKEAVENREKWQTIPLHDLPLDRIKAIYNRRGPLRYADAAARLDRVDWQILLDLKREGPNLLLPDVQGLRELAGALKVRFRIEVAERRYDDAVHTAQTMFALARHFGEHPTIIGDLVGIAIAFVAIGPVDEMIQQPGSPNLFWALTDLPSPLVDLRLGVQGERAMMMSLFNLMDERAPMSEAQMEKAVDAIRQIFKAWNLKKDVRQTLDRLAKDADHVRAARRRLTEVLGAGDAIDKFPALQVVLLDEKRDYEERRDAEARAMALPFWQARTFLRAGTRPEGERENALLAELAPSFSKVKMARARLEQRIGLLRCVEALRIYAAAHEGRLPAKLADVDLPLPVDAVTGEPFVYELKGTTAIIRGTPPRGMEKTLGYNVRYEVTIGE